MTNLDVIPKSVVIRLLEDLPENVSFEELIDRLVYLFKVEQGYSESKAHKGKSIDEILFRSHEQSASAGASH
ncbi:MAG: hypothetical protein SFV52_08340 [Saprospiraceae bacterium]|nr:hypothetical protein [Saprospiraceae bacterium]